MKKLLLLFIMFSEPLINYGQTADSTIVHPSDAGYNPSQEPVEVYTAEIKNNVAYYHNAKGELVEETAMKKRGFFKKRYI